MKHAFPARTIDKRGCAAAEKDRIKPQMEAGMIGYGKPGSQVSG
jgi:hypothetical protein